MPKISLLPAMIGKMSRSKLGAVCGDVERSGRIAGVDQARSNDKVMEQVVVTDINHLLKEIGVQHICLLKADIEGAEQAELLHCDKFPLALSFEYHLTRGLEEDEWNKVEHRLTQLGYQLFVHRQKVYRSIDPTVFAQRPLTSAEQRCSSCMRRWDNFFRLAFDSLFATASSCAFWCQDLEVYGTGG